MINKILILGLPSSGKTTMTNTLSKLLSECPVVNGDDIRTKYNDWDFSIEGRIRQANRMVTESKIYYDSSYVIIDFVCPLPEMRNIVSADWTIWMDTVDKSQYEDTNNIFQKPNSYDFRIVEKNVDTWAKFIADHILNNRRRPVFNPRQPTVQMLGRWQPWHPGHQALFEVALAKTGQVAIMVRDCQGYQDKNPFDFNFVKDRIDRCLEPKFQGQYTVLLVPNITNITYGRDVGYTITQEHLGEEIHKISATEIRKQMNL